jgi:uncharacterized membrane protein (UPF0136 family)
LEDTTIEDVLKTVEALYAQKDYQKALETLAANKGKISESVWHYNVGTVYGKLENWPMARYHLTLAEWEGLSSKEVISNKNFVETKLDAQKLERPISASDYFVKGGIQSSQGILSSLSLFVVLIGLIVFWKKKSIRALVASLVVAGIVLGVNFWIHSWDKMIVVSTQVIKDGPSEIFGAREEIPVGLMIVGTKKGDWVEVIYPSRYQGWIKFTGLKEL